MEDGSDCGSPTLSFPTLKAGVQDRLGDARGIDRRGCATSVWPVPNPIEGLVHVLAKALPAKSRRNRCPGRSARSASRRPSFNRAPSDQRLRICVAPPSVSWPRCSPCSTGVRPAKRKMTSSTNFADGEDDGDTDMSVWERASRIAQNIGRLLAKDPDVRGKFLAELLIAPQALRSFDCGRGLAEGTEDLDAMWRELVSGLRKCRSGDTQCDHTRRLPLRSAPAQSQLHTAGSRGRNRQPGFGTPSPVPSIPH
jgi:hypothetical protein